MPEIEVDDLASLGEILDVPPYQLPPEAWNLALNMRVRDRGLEAIQGWSQVFGTPIDAPHHLLPMSSATADFWLYASLTKIMVYDGSVHTDLTRTVGGPYTASATQDWNSTVLGGIAIMNNGTDVPQFWANPTIVTKFANLTNWPGTLRAKVIRAFGPFLMGFNITKGATVYPHMVKWSHPADPGSVPVSWDETDVTKDAGEVDLPDVASGTLVDAFPFGEMMYAYKQGSVRKIRFIGGRSIFDFGQSAWISTSGILAARCVCNTGDGQWQVWASQDDIMRHNGNTYESVLTSKQRKELFRRIDTTNYITSFMFPNPAAKEIWFCYPSQGMAQPNSAIIISYENPNNWVCTSVDGITFRHSAVGPIPNPLDDDWEANDDAWDADEVLWDDLKRRRTVLAGTDASKFYNLDDGSTKDTLAFTSTLRREGLAVVGRKRSGEPIVDFQQRLMASRVWPKIQGGPVSIRIGSQQLVNGPTAYTPSVNFDPATQMFCDPLAAEGRAIAIEFSTQRQWRIDGYKYDIDPLGTL